MKVFVAGATGAVGQPLVPQLVARGHEVVGMTSKHENVDVVYSRYRRRGDLSLDESFFPVMWHESGYRTPWLTDLPRLD